MAPQQARTQDDPSTLVGETRQIQVGHRMVEATVVGQERDKLVLEAGGVRMKMTMEDWEGWELDEDDVLDD